MTSDEKRKKIIREQADREAAERAAANADPRPKPRSNWAASPSRRFTRRGFGAPTPSPGKR